MNIEKSYMLLTQAAKILNITTDQVLFYDNWPMQVHIDEIARAKSFVAEAELLLDIMPNSDNQPQLDKHDVIRWVDFEEQMPPITTWVCFRYKDEEVDTGHFRNEDEIQRWIAKYRPIAWCLLPPFV